MFLFIVHNSVFFFSNIVSRLQKASEFSITVESQEYRRAKRGIKRSIRLCPAPRHVKTPAAGDSGGLSRSAGNPVER